MIVRLLVKLLARRGGRRGGFEGTDMSYQSETSTVKQVKLTHPAQIGDWGYKVRFSLPRKLGPNWGADRGYLPHGGAHDAVVITSVGKIK